jgi:hypothetical protein
MDFGALPTIWSKYRYSWDQGQQWQAICEHEAQTPIYPNAARDIVGYLRNPPPVNGVPNIAGIHYAVDAQEIWRGTDHRDRAFGRSPHCYYPSRWSVGIEHAGRTVPGNYDSPAGDAVLTVSAVLHLGLIEEWEARPENAGRRFPLVVLDVDGVIAREPGLFTHETSTKACEVMHWGQNGHYDGRYYPFPRLIEKIEQLRGEAPQTPPDVPEEDDMLPRPTFFIPGSGPDPATGLQPYVEVDPNLWQVHGWHGVRFEGVGAESVDEAFDGALRTVDFTKFNNGNPLRAFHHDEATGDIVGFVDGAIFRVRAVVG